MAKKQKTNYGISSDDKAKQSFGTAQDRENIKDEKSGEVFLHENAKEVKTPERKEALEKKELQDVADLKENIRQEIEKVDLDDSLKQQVQSSAHKLGGLDDQKKIQNLLVIAKKKGVVFAVNVAKKMNNPYILDIFHDTLVKNGILK